MSLNFSVKGRNGCVSNLQVNADYDPDFYFHIAFPFLQLSGYYSSLLFVSDYMHYNITKIEAHCVL